MKHFILMGVFASFYLLPNTGVGQILSTTGTHTVSICPDSTVWTWGQARLGDEPGTSQKSLPVQVKGSGGTGFLDGATAVATSGGATYVILEDSTLWSWGAGSNGRLGTGNTSNQDYPIPVLGPNGIGVMDSAIAITGHYQSGFVLRANGSVWGWGWNGVGGLGDGTYFNSRTSPVQVVERTSLIPLDSIVSISSGPSFGLALDEDGTVWAWGDDNYGEIGQNMVGSIYLGAVKVKDPSGVGLLDNIIAVKAGDHFALALRNDGTVWAWGQGDLGQLGDGTFLGSDLPIQVKNVSGQGFLQNIVSIQTGDDHALALDSSGGLFAWGFNMNGQLGDLTKEAWGLPLLIPAISDIESILAEGNISAVFNSSGELFMWGKNDHGPLGNGDLTIDRVLPAYVLGQTGIGNLTNVTQIGTGYERQNALLSNGQVVRWGEIAKTSTLDGNPIESPIPVLVQDSTGSGVLSNIQKISSGENHVLVLTNSGVAMGWGSTGNGQLSNQPFSFAKDPVAIKYFNGGILDQVSDIAASSKHSMYLMNDSTVKYTGVFNSTSRYYPFEVTTSSGGPALDSIVAIAAGTDVMLALHEDSTVWAWGVNFNGQLGDGTTTKRNYPVRVKDSSGTGFLSGIVSIDFFEDVAMALKSDGTVWTWGDNSSGQLGTGNNISTLLPRAVLDSAGTIALSSITAIAASELHCLALASDSTVWAWGLNVRGNFGDSSRISSYLPVLVLDKTGSPLGGIIDIDAGVLLSSFLMNDGRVKSTGFNLEGQTGTYNALGEALPVQTLVPCRLFAPEAGFTVSQTVGCEGACIQFVDTSSFSPTKTIWTFEGGDIMNSTDPSPTVCYSTPGSYAVTLVVENSAGIDSLVKAGFITVHPNPDVDAGVDTIACVGDTIGLLASGGQTYTWSPGSNLSCLNCPNPVVMVTSTKTYIVTGVDVNGCSDLDTILVEANPLPVANAGADESVCLGDSVQLLGTGGGDYLWSPGMNATCNTCPDPKIGITAAGKFVLQITDANGCVDTDTVAISIAPMPIAGFSYVLDSMAFTISTTNLSQEADEIIWSFGDGSSDTSLNASHTYLANGQYDLCMVAINECGRDTICQQVEITSVGILEKLASGFFTIDPNPTSGKITLHFLKDEKEGEVLISDLHGKIVSRISVHPTSGMDQDLELNLPSGIYLYWFESKRLRTTANSLLIRN